MAILKELLKESKKAVKTSKEGFVIGSTKKGGDITVHGIKYDTNGNWVYVVNWPGRNRKSSVQHMAAAGHLTKIIDLNDFKDMDSNASKVAKEVVDYINKHVIK